MHKNLFYNVISNKWKIIKQSFFLYFNMNLFGYIGSILNYVILGIYFFFFKNFDRNLSPGLIHLKYR
jgi:hypothetical protein